VSMTTPTPTIRPATPADAAELAAFLNRVFRETFAADNRPADMDAYCTGAFGPARQLAEIESPRVRVLLAECDGLVGCAQLRAGPPPACVTADRPIELRRFYVDRPWHGRGVAAALLQAVMEIGRAEGARTLWLGVWERNPRAVRFYGKFGFVDVGSQQFQLGDDTQTDRLMVVGL
jgi:diamine N-acetyltransferase